MDGVAPSAILLILTVFSVVCWIVCWVCLHRSSDIPAVPAVGKLAWLCQKSQNFQSDRACKLVQIHYFG